MFERISMVGLGYIGLPTAALFAAHGTKVIGVDVSAHVVETINAGKIHLVEPDLDGVVHKVVTEGSLHATLEPDPADAFIIAVPTPPPDPQPSLKETRSILFVAVRGENSPLLVSLASGFESFSFVVS